MGRRPKDRRTPAQIANDDANFAARSMASMAQSTIDDLAFELKKFTGDPDPKKQPDRMALEQLWHIIKIKYQGMENVYLQLKDAEKREVDLLIAAM